MAARTPTINRATPALSSGLERYCGSVDRPAAFVFALREGGKSDEGAHCALRFASVPSACDIMFRL